MAAKLCIALSLAAVSPADAVFNGKGQAFLESNMQPDVVARTLSRVEDEWKAQAAVFTECSSTVGLPGASIVNCADAPSSFGKSCNTVVSAIIQGSGGDKDVTKEYMADVCSQRAISGWHQQQCHALDIAIRGAMTADKYENRVSFSTQKLCGKHWSHFLKEEEERTAAERAAREAAEKVAAAEAEEAERKKAEEVKKQAEKQQVEQAEREKQEAAAKAAETKAQAAEAAAKVAEKKAEAEEVAEAAKKKMAEAQAAEDEHQKIVAKNEAKAKDVTKTTKEQVPQPTKTESKPAAAPVKPVAEKAAAPAANKVVVAAAPTEAPAAPKAVKPVAAAKPVAK